MVRCRVKEADGGQGRRAGDGERGEAELIGDARQMRRNDEEDEGILCQS